MSPQLSVVVVGLLVSSAVFGFCSARYILYTDDILVGGQSLTNGKFKFTMQRDCNLVLSDDSASAIWESETNGQGTSCYVKMQSDGNLVIYDNHEAKWASGNVGMESSYVCILQRDRQVVVYGPQLWSTARAADTPGVLISANSTDTATRKESNATPDMAIVINN
ncbi:mannose-specific lectin-like [Ananas comosus]|uniref:non-specific serine/threonine protein kinase n=1 Tax=Ananas comosus TaxID=4615 RepID=A0A6P5G7A1_ANACO|nr:mannose-specific lectin-like [Ananas comosus]